MRRLVSVLVIGVLATGALAAQRGSVAGLASQTWTVDGVTRSALVAASRGGVRGPGAPVVLVFHGHGGSSANAARTFRIHEFWPEALVIYPQGLPTVGQITDPEGRRPGWQHVPGGEGDRDLKLVDAMLAWAKTNHRVDPTRVFAAGHSNGGSMVYVLWAARGQAFTAFAPSSSIFRPDVIRTARPKPAFVVAGEKDALVPFANQRRSLAALLRLNEASATSEPWSGGAVRHASHAGADVVSYLHPGGHQMPPDTGELIVKFFRSVTPR